MTKKTQTILLVSIGVFVMLVIAVVGGGILAIRSMVDSAGSDEATATKAMDAVRARFPDAKPLLVLEAGGLTLARRPPETPPSTELKTLHILLWNTDEEQLTRVDIPFWILRWRDSPIDVAFENEAAGSGVKLRTKSSVRVSDIERFGPSLIVDDDFPDGGHIVIWSD